MVAVQVGSGSLPGPFEREESTIESRETETMRIANLDKGEAFHL